MDNYWDISSCSHGLGTFAWHSCCLLIRPSHRTVTTWISERGTLLGTAAKDSLSKAPPSSTSPSFSVRHASITSRTDRAATWYTDQVRGATKTANCCMSADVNMYVYLFFFCFLQWVTSLRSSWTSVNMWRPWKARDWCSTARPLQSWTPERTSPGTTPERWGQDSFIRPTEGKLLFLHPWQHFRGLVTCPRVASFQDLELFTVKISP